MTADAAVKAACVTALASHRRWLGARAVARLLHMGLNPAPVALALHDLWTERAIQRISVPSSEARLLYAMNGLPKPAREQLADVALQSQPGPEPKTRHEPRPRKAPLFRTVIAPDGRIAINGDGVMLALDPERLYWLRREISHALKSAHRKGRRP